MPVHHDDEYRVRLEKEELLKQLRTGMEAQEYLRLSDSPIPERHGPEKAGKTAARKPDRLDGIIETNMLALLRVLVLQNELVLYALSRLEDTVSARPKSFNPADWK